MKNNTHRWVIAVALLQGCSEPEIVDAVPASAVASIASLHADGLYGTYGFSMTATFALENGNAEGGFVLEGEAVLADDALELRVDACKPSSDKLTATPALEELCSQISGRHPVRRGGLGSIEQIGLTPGLGLQAEAVVKEVASVLQLTRPESAGAQWTAVEHDHGGIYTAEYRDAGTGTLIRSRDGYDQIPGESGLRAVAAGEMDGSASTRFDLSSGRIDRITHQERFSRDSAGQSELPNSSYSLQMTLIRRGDAPASRSAADGQAYAWVSPWSPSSDAAVRRAIDDGRIGKRDPDEFIVALSRRLSERPPREAEQARSEYDQAYLALISLLRVHPETHQQVVDACADTASWCEPGLGALGASGTLEAQAALRAIFAQMDAKKGRSDSEAAAKLRRESIRALGTRLLGPPTTETIDLLASMIHDPTVGSQAAYGLGAHCRSASAAGQPALADRAMTSVRGLLQSSDTRHQLLALRAMSNAGVPEILEHIEPFLGDEREEFRSAATKALLRLSDEDAAPVVRKTLASDSEFETLSGLTYLRHRGHVPDASTRDQLKKLADGGRQEPARQARALLDSWASAD